MGKNGTSASTFAARRNFNTRRLRQERRRKANLLRTRLRSHEVRNPHQRADVATLRTGAVSQAFQLAAEGVANVAWRDARVNTVSMHLHQIERTATDDLASTLMAMAENARGRDHLAMQPADTLSLYIRLDGLADQAEVAAQVEAFRRDMSDEQTTAAVEVRYTADGLTGSDFRALRNYLVDQSSNRKKDKSYRQLVAKLDQLATAENTRTGRQREVTATRELVDAAIQLIDAAESSHQNPEVRATRNRALNNLKTLLEQRQQQLEADPQRDLGIYGRLPDIVDSDSNREDQIAADSPYAVVQVAADSASDRSDRSESLTETDQISDTASSRSAEGVANEFADDGTLRESANVPDGPSPGEDPPYVGLSSLNEAALAAIYNQPPPPDHSDDGSN